MDNQYFTPSIEDIRVGYECEIWWNYNYLPENEWCVVRALEGSTEDFDLYDFTSRIKKNEIRIPYLTKEQIRDDGWKVITPTSNLTNEGIYFFEKANYFLIFDSTRDLPFLDFILRDPSKEERVHSPERFRFFCDCKDINTFRYISKLLGI